MDHSQIIASVDNVTAAAHYYPATTGDVGLEMGNHTVVGIGFVVAGGVTVTVEACMRRLDTVSAEEYGLSDAWVDISKQFDDLAAGANGTASWVDTNGILQANGLAVERIRVKCVASDTSNSIDLWIKRF